MVERFIDLNAIVLKHAAGNLYPSIFQDLKSHACMARVWIGGPNHHATDLRINDGVCARWGSPVSRTWFESNEEGRALSSVPSFFAIVQRFNFGVRPAGSLVPTAANDFAASHQDGPDHGIGRSRAESAPGQAESQTHVVSVGRHKKNPKAEIRSPKEIRNPKPELLVRRS